MKRDPGPKERYEGALEHVGYADFERMRIQSRTREIRHARWTPQWAMDDRKVRLVVYNKLWNYAMYGQGRHSRKTTVVPGLPLRDLEQRAEELRQSHSQKGSHEFDKHTEDVRYHGGTAAMYTAIIYMAYRQRLTAVEIAAQLGKSPVTVRQYLYLFNCIARKLFRADEMITPHPTAKRPRVNRRNPIPKCKRLFGKERLAELEKDMPLYREMAYWKHHGATWADLGAVFGMHKTIAEHRLRKLGLVNVRRNG